MNVYVNWESKKSETDTDGVDFSDLRDLHVEILS